MTSSATRRCFIGLAPDEATCAYLHEQVNAVLDPHDWKLHPPEDLHLTLCFLGKVEEARIPSLVALLRTEITLRAMPELTLQSPGSFGEPEAPRVLWIGVESVAQEFERLIALRQAAACSIDRAGLRWDSAGTFTPHLTVARPRRKAALPAAFTDLAFDVIWRPTEVVLFASMPGARPHYPRIEAIEMRR